MTSSLPGIFAVVNADGSSAAFNPASPGSVISIYATGEGQTSPAGVDGKAASSPLPQPVLPIKVYIDGQPAEVDYAGAAPGLIAGVLQVNVRVPTNLPSFVSIVAVVLQVGDATSFPSYISISKQ